MPNAISPALLRACEAAWPEPSWNGWHRYKGATADKYGSLHHSLIPRACMAALDALAELASTRIGNSFIDYDLHAAGLHMMPPGGFLGRHLDAECHPIRPWRRTHSIVLFVNHQWGELCGGQLILEPDHRIDVNPNTAVVFETADRWHSVNRVGTDISGLHRKTLALFAWELSDCAGAIQANFSGSMVTAARPQ